MVLPLIVLSALLDMFAGAAHSGRGKTFVGEETGLLRFVVRSLSLLNMEMTNPRFVGSFRGTAFVRTELCEI